MEQYTKRPVIHIENTRFIYATNFAGTPDPKYGNSTRSCNIVIPTEEQANEIANYGIEVRQTKPRAGEEEGFVPTYFFRGLLNYDSEFAKNRPPKVFLVGGSAEPRLLGAEEVGIIDNVYVVNVDCSLEVTHLKKYDRTVAYISTMYVSQDVDDDPFAAKYFGNASSQEVPESDDEIPFE